MWGWEDCKAGFCGPDPLSADMEDWELGYWRSLERLAASRPASGLGGRA